MKVSTVTVVGVTGTMGANVAGIFVSFGNATRMFLDCYKQIIGQAGAYQVQGAKNAMMLNIGGSATTNYVFIVSI